MKKIKVFLGGYINHTNAQNLNCQSLAKHMNKDRFEVYTLEAYSGDLPRNEIEGVHVFNCFYPFRLSRLLGFLWGVLKSDVLYLPKGEPEKFPLILARLLKKPCFATVEGVINDEYIDFCKTIGKDPLKPIAYWKRFEHLYAITGYIRRYMGEKFGLRFRDETLYLGIDTDTFAKARHKVTALRNIVMIGNALKEKGIDEYLLLAQKFPHIDFHVVGAGHDLADRRVLENLPANVRYHGVLNHAELTKLLRQVDLHILFSKTEGFPKVVIETAAAGIPSLVYSHYGAGEWITHTQDGFVVDSFDEAVETVKTLDEDSDKIPTVSDHAVKMAGRFAWQVRIGDWEEVIENLYRKAAK